MAKVTSTRLIWADGRIEPFEVSESLAEYPCIDIPLYKPSPAVYHRPIPTMGLPNVDIPPRVRFRKHERLDGQIVYFEERWVVFVYADGRKETYMMEPDWMWRDKVMKVERTGTDIKTRFFKKRILEDRKIVYLEVEHG